MDLFFLYAFLVLEIVAEEVLTSALLLVAP